jgi:transposase
MLRAEQRIAELEAETTSRRADNTALRAQIQELVAQVQELQARLAKDRHNSSTPPSSDPLGRKRRRSQRLRSGKQPGGQLGQAGETLQLLAPPQQAGRVSADGL